MILSQEGETASFNDINITESNEDVNDINLGFVNFNIYDGDIAIDDHFLGVDNNYGSNNIKII